MVNWKVGVKFSGIVLLQYRDCLEEYRLDKIYPRHTIGKLLCLYRQNIQLSQSLHRIRNGR
jgi:hypothetical protein